MSSNRMAKRIRLFVAASLVAGATSIVTAAPAHACFNPDDPVCPTRILICNATEKAAKYRDRVLECYS